jgi:starch phosphorylase
MSSPEIDVRAQLDALARNYRWTWSTATRAVFARLREASPCDALHPLALVAENADAALEADPSLGGAIGTAYGALQDELAHTPEPTIAYFSPEFAISETLPQYSGGLGVLAGDHLKAASDAGLPLVGVGLLYREGFFHQEIDGGGTQTERYEPLDPAAAALVDTGIRVGVEVADEEVQVAVWRAEVGRVSLYLLDTLVPGNSAGTSRITDRLYGGDNQHRLRQELILGIGGVRALRALGIQPSVFHLNEGHAGFLALELLHDLLREGRSLDEAVEAVRGEVVFTTHTPVPAGMDRFPDNVLSGYLDAWDHLHDVPVKELLELGRMPGDPPHVFNMAAFCLRLAGRANGVSRLHGQVSRKLFSGIRGAEAIGHVTNGVHARTWVSSRLQSLFDRELGPSWAEGDAAAWSRVDYIDDDELRAVRREDRQELFDRIDCEMDGDLALDPEALTIGFARRFATYKRAALLLLQRDRLAALLGDDRRPVQFVFAGKAHPADGPGKAVLHQIVEASREPWSRGRIVFLPDYDIGLARVLVAGCDVWLNNPLRPFEASGTSGMKAALNGGLNCSTLDGWWDELYDGENGWAIPTSELRSAAARDRAESVALFELLEREIAPLYYGTDGGGPSAGWLERVRQNWRSLGPAVTAARMVDDYRRATYEFARS